MSDATTETARAVQPSDLRDDKIRLTRASAYPANKKNRSAKVTTPLSWINAICG